MKTYVRSNLLTIVENKKISNDCYFMKFSGDDFSDCEYGQFVNIKIDGLTLRRQISISEYDDDSISIIYKVVGEGTRILGELNIGEKLDVLYPLGVGYEDVDVDNILLVGGGIGIAPLIGYYKYLKSINKNVSFLAGFRDEENAIILDDFKYDYVSYSMNIIDEVGKKKYDYYYGCGPMKMLQALADFDENGQLLLESKMACGFGICMACPVKTNDGGYKRVCVEGPMFYAKELNAKS